MIIAKAENGNVELRDNDGNAYEVLPPNARLQKDSSRQIIKVIYAQNNILTIPFAEVDFLQTDPAAAVAFTGTLQELFDDLKANFFFDVTDTIVQDYPNAPYSFKANDTKSGQSIAANLLVASKIYIPFDFTLNILYLRYSASVAGASVLGLYSIGTDGDPDELLIQTPTEYNTAVTSSQGVSITPTLFKKGYYAVVYHSNVTNSINAFSNASNFPNWGSVSTILATNVFGTITAPLTYTGTLPTVFPTGTLSVSVAAPYVIFSQ